jgi:hypothetical protein
MNDTLSRWDWNQKKTDAETFKKILAYYQSPYARLFGTPAAIDDLLSIVQELHHRIEVLEKNVEGGREK